MQVVFREKTGKNQDFSVESQLGAVSQERALRVCGAAGRAGHRPLQGVCVIRCGSEKTLPPGLSFSGTA